MSDERNEGVAALLTEMEDYKSGLLSPADLMESICTCLALLSDDLSAMEEAVTCDET